MQIFEQRKRAFQKRRDYLHPSSCGSVWTCRYGPMERSMFSSIIRRGLGHRHGQRNVLAAAVAEADITAVPGLDFGPTHGRQMVRFSYATNLDRLHKAVDRKRHWLGA